MEKFFMLIKNGGETSAIEVEGYKIGKEYFATKRSDGWSFVDIASGMTVAKSLDTWRACRDYYKGMSDADKATIDACRAKPRYEKAKALIAAESANKIS